jgi:hypothetical protein
VPEVHLYLWIEAAVVAGIVAMFLIQAFFLFKPEHIAHRPLRVKIGAFLQGLIVGGLVGLVLLPLRLSFFLPELPAPPQAIASTAVLPAFVLLLVIRRGLLARAPVIGRYLRAYRQAALKHDIDLAQKRLARLQSMDKRQRAGTQPDA